MIKRNGTHRYIFCKIFGFLLWVSCYNTVPVFAFLDGRWLFILGVNGVLLFTADKGAMLDFKPNDLLLWQCGDGD